MNDELNETNLMIEESAIMKDVSCDLAFRIIQSILQRKEKIIDTSEVLRYEYYIIKENSNNYIQYRHEKKTGWATTLLPIRALVEIHLKQIKKDVIMTIKMFKRLKTSSPLNQIELTPEYARLIWIDHVLEIFKAAKVEDFAAVKKRLITNELLEKRTELVNKSKRKLCKIILLVTFFLTIVVLLSWLHNLRLG